MNQVGQLLRNGRLQEAESLCRSMLAQSPGLAPAHSALGQILARKGDAHSAIEHLQAAANAEPSNAMHHMLLGRTSGMLGDLQAEVTHLKRAVDLDPRLWQARLALALARTRLHEPDAEHALKDAIDAAPGDPQSLKQLAMSLRGQGSLPGAILALERLTKVTPRDPEVWLELGTQCFQARQWEACEAAARTCIELTPSSSGPRALLCRLLERINRVDEALEEGERAEALDPRSPSVALELGRVLQRLGRHEDAKSRFERALATPGLPDEALASLNNHLGVTLDAMGEYDRAFTTIVKGQEAWLRQPRTARLSLDIFPQRLRAYDSVDWKAAAARWPKERPSHRQRPAPIFFVGFPRSGTTLLETMLSAHPNIAATDEQPFLTQVINTVRRKMTPGSEFPPHFASLPDSAMDELEEAYWTFATRDLGPDAVKDKRLLDKLPLNICFLPVVRRIWPDARVLVALRDPRDVCLSCLFQPFGPNDAMVHLARLDTTTALYAQVMALWQRYRDELGLHVFESRYEDLVAEPETRVRAILDFLGEPWDEAVMKFAERKRDVRTPSYAGVASKVHTRSVKRWERYRSQFEPFLPRLEPFVQAFGYEAS